VRETRDRYVFKADMPGVKEPDIEVNVTGNRLSIAGTRATEEFEETDTIYTEERTFGNFARSFVLPEGADLEHVQAALRDGVLTVVIPKVPEVKPRKIALEAGGKLKA
jgi:HSP20 family protein